MRKTESEEMVDSLTVAYKAVCKAKDMAWYDAINRYGNLINEYRQMCISQSDFDYIKWHDDKFRSFRVAPCMHNGAFAGSIARELAN